MPGTGSSWTHPRSTIRHQSRHGRRGWFGVARDRAAALSLKSKACMYQHNAQLKPSLQFECCSRRKLRLMMLHSTFESFVEGVLLLRVFLGPSGPPPAVLCCRNYRGLQQHPKAASPQKLQPFSQAARCVSQQHETSAGQCRRAACQRPPAAPTSSLAQRPTAPPAPS